MIMTPLVDIPISLGNNNIGDEGATSIAEGLKENHTLTELE